MDPKAVKESLARKYLCDSEQKAWHEFLSLMHRVGLRTPAKLAWTFPKQM